MQRLGPVCLDNGISDPIEGKRIPWEQRTEILYLRSSSLLVPATNSSQRVVGAAVGLWGCHCVRCGSSWSGSAGNDAQCRMLVQQPWCPWMMAATYCSVEQSCDCLLRKGLGQLYPCPSSPPAAYSACWEGDYFFLAQRQDQLEPLTAAS